MSSDILYQGYVLMADGSGLKTVDIRRDGEYVNVWVDDNLADDIGNDVEDFKSSYGTNLYDTLEDFRNNIGYSVEDFWPDDIS